MNDETGQIIIERLNVLIRLTALKAMQDRSFKDQVRILSDVGLQPKEIAEILGKTPNHVSVTLNSIRKERVVKAKKGPS